MRPPGVYESFSAFRSPVYTGVAKHCSVLKDGNIMSVLGEEMEVVEYYRNLAVHNRLNWKYNIESVHRKEQNRPFKKA